MAIFNSFPKEVRFEKQSKMKNYIEFMTFMSLIAGRKKNELSIIKKEADVTGCKNCGGLFFR